MRLVRISALLLILAFTLTACGGDSPATKSKQSSATTTANTDKKEDLVPGYSGGCSDGYKLFVQADTTPYGATYRTDVRAPGGDGTLEGNQALKIVGWYLAPPKYRVQDPEYARNPEGFQTHVWFYAEGVGWLADASLRSKRIENDTTPNEITVSLAPSRKKVCELTAN